MWKLLPFLACLTFLGGPTTGECDLLFNQTYDGIPHQVVGCHVDALSPPSERLLDDITSCFTYTGYEGPYQSLDGYSYWTVSTLLATPMSNGILLGIHFDDKRIYVTTAYPSSVAAQVEIYRHELTHAICPECEHGTAAFEVCSFPDWREIFESGDVDRYIRGPGTYRGGLWPGEGSFPPDTARG